MLAPTEVALAGAQSLVRYAYDEATSRVVLDSFTGSVEEMTDLMVALSALLMTTMGKRTAHGVAWEQIGAAPPADDADGVTALADAVVSYTCLDDLAPALIAVRQADGPRRLATVFLLTRAVAALPGG